MAWSIRSDICFNGIGGLSALSKWWIDLGIRPERIKPGKPQQNGRHERMHRTLKNYLHKLGKIEQDLAKQQTQSDELKKEFNEFRSHEGLDGDVPSNLYLASPRVFPNRIKTYDYDELSEVRKVKQSGEIKWQGQVFYISQVLAGEYIALMPYGDEVWDIFYHFHLLGQMNKMISNKKHYQTNNGFKCKPRG